MGLEILHVYKLPGDAAAAGLWATLGVARTFHKGLKKSGVFDPVFIVLFCHLDCRLLLKTTTA